jgi:aryl-alcohol dehydrogenase-like predicted oxidoreductase
MLNRTLGATNICVSQVGLGTWPLAGNAGLNGYGKKDETAAESTIYEALAAGITIFDTADVYGDGFAESLLGRILPGGAAVFIVTKGGLIPSSGQFEWNSDAITRRAEASLNRLRRNTLDAYLLHNPPPYLLATGDIYRYLERLRSRNMVRFLGVSVARAEDAWLILDRPEVDIIELPFSLTNLTADFGLITEAARRGKAVVAREVLANGFLSDCALAGKSFEAADFRASVPSEVVDQIRQTTTAWSAYRRSDESWTDFALRFVLDRPEVSVALVGTRKPDHIPALKRAGTVPCGPTSWCNPQRS